MFTPLHNLSVGPLQFTLERAPDLLVDTDKQADVACWEQKIRLNAPMGGDYETATILHEVQHIFYDQAGVEDVDEAAIEATAYGFLSLMRHPENVWFAARVLGINEEALLVAFEYFDDSQAEGEG